MQQLLLWLSMLLMPTPGVEINTASLEALIRIGIPPVHAQQIISVRKEAGPFNTPADLLEVDGIGQQSFARIKASLSVNGQPLPLPDPAPIAKGHRINAERNPARDEREGSRDALRTANR